MLNTPSDRDDEKIVGEIFDREDIDGFFSETFLFEDGTFANGEKFGKISFKSSPEYYLQYTIHTDSYYLDTIYAPGNGSNLLLALFHHAHEEGVRWIDGNARTNDESRNSQEQLEDWYRKFGFETISKDVDGTKMRALTYNRPIKFRLEKLIQKIKKRTTQSLPSA